LDKKLGTHFSSSSLASALIALDTAIYFSSILEWFWGTCLARWSLYDGNCLLMDEFSK
jgi:hypothetical protein